ncbi:hypothetical protein LF1_48090 [Rubripirellula obstinata]|uniref:Transcobalamin-like C-terminal domain-containing protein n=1 Tax=Rubripirellula obstinata TaxID=406547 RepID=A0A5B1CM35_9BACT|nr:DUF4430 domain-containing protein [Rubripirellula obstinata]KAA1262247.1 hypothetical protein LF1_48090 [Rubripirellula obstinata]
MRILGPLFLLIALAGCTTQTQEPDTNAATGVVTFEFKTGDETEVVNVEGIADGETVESVMRKIDEVEVSISGSGTTAFVNKIGEKATANGEGWTYTIDGQRAERGIGATPLSPPATVTWEYGEF